MEGVAVHENRAICSCIFRSSFGAPGRYARSRVVKISRHALRGKLATTSEKLPSVTESLPGTFLRKCLVCVDEATTLDCNTTLVYKKNFIP